MKTLAIDTSNQTMAVAVVDGTEILGQIQTMVNKNHSTSLMPAIQMLMENIKLTPQDLERIVVAQGPGSYTGLRIGVTTAKTLADTLGIELVGVSSLMVVAANCIGISQTIVPIFDARRQNVYAGGYRWVNGLLQCVFPDQHLPFHELLEYFKEDDIYLVGVDTAKFPVAHESVTINKVPQWDYPSGVVLASLGMASLVEEEIHGFLPKYLKLVEAEEKWLASHEPEAGNYVEKI